MLDPRLYFPSSNLWLPGMPLANPNKLGRFGVCADCCGGGTCSTCVVCNGCLQDDLTLEVSGLTGDYAVLNDIYVVTRCADQYCDEFLLCPFGISGEQICAFSYLLPDIPLFDGATWHIRLSLYYTSAVYKWYACFCYYHLLGVDYAFMAYRDLGATKPDCTPWVDMLIDEDREHEYGQTSYEYFLND